MRRKRLSLAVTAALAVLTCTTLSVGPAQAASGSLTVTTLGRNGAVISSNLNLTNTQTGEIVQAKSGKRVWLAKGQWAVVADIETPDNSPFRMSDTLTAVQVSVSGSTSLTLDARRGKRVSASVDATSGGAAAKYNTLETAVACPANDIAGEVGVYNVPGEIFEIPNPNSTYFHFAWMQTWTSNTWPGASDYYAVTKETSGLPTSPNASFRQSSMAKVSVSLRSGESAQPVDALRVTPAPANTDCQTMLYGQSDMNMGQGTPFNSNAYVSPGRWSLQGYNSQGAQGTDATTTRTFAAGSSNWQDFSRAVWGPTAGLPYVTNRSVTYTPYKTIADASAGTDGAADTRNVVTLSKSGRVLKRQTLTNTFGSSSPFSAQITSAGWYELTVAATRLQAAQLSTGVTLDWHFYADPAHTQVAPGYLAELSPSFLHSSNAATRGITTPVTVTLARTDEPWSGSGEHFAPDSVKSLQVYASHDNGRTWHAVTVRRSGWQWVASVPEPTIAGTVALRTVATGTAGDTSVQTVYNAYLVG
ncbi:hypothetical protein ABIA33_003894 [Streptacidiphilus sp. MAP12-16]|uniref:hypothetical protein n=1 Tax=Streptacidiphilus sp. MAP12-16 TaxID=3156300 RepID=UPI0035165C8B